MKNNCDVRGSSPECRIGDCDYFAQSSERGCIWSNVFNECLNLAAIRAAIEAEHKDGERRYAGSNCDSCAHADEEMDSDSCSDCHYQVKTDTWSNWEPANHNQEVKK